MSCDIKASPFAVIIGHLIEGPSAEHCPILYTVPVSVSAIFSPSTIVAVPSFSVAPDSVFIISSFFALSAEISVSSLVILLSLSLI